MIMMMMCTHLYRRTVGWLYGDDSWTRRSQCTPVMSCPL